MEDVELLPYMAPGEEEVDVPVISDTIRPLEESNREEYKMRRKQKKDSNTMIQRVRFKPIGKSRFPIPLCRLRCLPLVRPINEVDVGRLKNELVMGYRDGDRAMYVSAYNKTLYSLIWDFCLSQINIWSTTTITRPKLYRQEFNDQPI